MTPAPARSSERVQVVAGVLRDAEGRILLAQRPAGKHLAGTWEFPGGKREPGESAPAALARELAEELGIRVESVSPWLTLTHAYPEIVVRLQLYTVDGWHGRPHGCEGQSLKWVTNTEMHSLPMPAADRPIVRAFTIDDRYAITPDPRESEGRESLLDWARAALGRGIRLFQLRAKSLDETALAGLGREFGRLMAEADARWLLNGPPELAAEVGADGVHLDAARLNRLPARPLSGEFLVAASCHDEAALARAGELALDFVTVSPVQPTASHPGADTLGWDGFGCLCRCSPLPVFALGGVTPADLPLAREHGGFGVAGIRAFGLQS
ncbi:Nudix family hydrolase [Wenzhouxiangella sp. XN201]|uniref:Nudix family hydrolase n=1 Tax=Wenzhouxiangella sp. XN201 TaxID=2710755 RepID=UPI0013C67D0C|nr:Nudix family hydrolase [Wenzhouxiangella sp. XN201]